MEYLYNLIKSVLKEETTIENSINAAQYLKDIVAEKEKIIFLKSLGKVELETMTVRPIKNILWKITVKYMQPYLLNSYYFTFE